MALRIDNPEADKLARELTRHTGETVTQAVITALRERLDRDRGRRQAPLSEELVRFGKECAALRS